MGTFGIGAVVVGAVLVGTGVSVSAKAAPHAATAQPDKKKPTTTTTSTLPPTTTTTQPCAAQSVTATGGSATMTADPGTCIVDGTVVSLTGSGFTSGSVGTFLECSSDANQPTVMFEGSPIPISCTNPLSTNNGPGITTVSSTGTIGPVNFKVATGTVGPPCGPNECAGVSATDSSGGSPFTDAANYPCPPTPAQVTAGDSCQILFGDLANDAVEVDLQFNPNQPPPSATTTTVATASSPSSGTTGTAAPSATKASSGALAFTGSGPALWWLALVGMLLIVLGVFALSMLEEPRRLARVAADRLTGRKRNQR
ncbi:MAG: hypothetical protein ACRDY1_05125 [Acidimicrobiales bacterium]